MNKTPSITFNYPANYAEQRLTEGWNHEVQDVATKLFIAWQAAQDLPEPTDVGMARIWKRAALWVKERRTRMGERMPQFEEPTKAK